MGMVEGLLGLVRSRNEPSTKKFMMAMPIYVISSEEIVSLTPRA